jgi:hypothetical protein
VAAPSDDYPRLATTGHPVVQIESLVLLLARSSRGSLLIYQAAGR